MTATFNIQKLERIIEQRRRAILVLRDISERYREAKDRTDSLRSQIMRVASKRAIESGFVEDILAMPVEKAYALKAKDVEEFFVESRDGRRVHYTDIPFQTFQAYITRREQFALLNAEREAGTRDFQSRFAIVPSLIDAVVAWGFQRPDLA